MLRKSNARAAKLLRGFTGTRTVKSRVARKPAIPDSVVEIGPILGIIYKIDNTGEKLHHAFASKAQPLLLVSHDGRQVFIVGGRFTFTDRGFVDRKK